MACIGANVGFMDLLLNRRKAAGDACDMVFFVAKGKVEVESGGGGGGKMTGERFNLS
jgi:hypothetical protein